MGFPEAVFKKQINVILRYSMTNERRPVDSMREAVFTVSPNRQYRGILSPTTPATTGPAFTHS